MALDNSLFSSEEYSRLVGDAVAAEKPDKEAQANKTYSFPRYMDGRIAIDPCSWTPTTRVEYVCPSRPGARSLRDYTMHRSGILADGRRACMIKNIPNRYTSEMLLRFINATHFGLYDFFYLRIDFRSGCNVGYAFINFVSSAAVLQFYDRINGHRWRSFGSSKVAELAYASIQGIENLKRKFRRSAVMLVDRAFRPKAFHVEGRCKGLEKEVFE